jgi:basic membrane protein A
MIMKKLKKLTSFLIISAMAMSLATGCSNKPASTPEQTTGKSMGDTTQAAKNSGDLIVAFIYDGEIGDKGYTAAHEEARQAIEAMDGVTTIYAESVSEDAASVEKVCEDFISQGATVIFGTSFGFMDGMLASADNHPEVVYEHATGYEVTENFGNYMGKIYQMRYLTGIVAGAQTESNSIGYVAAFPIPEVIRGINSFTLGVQSVNPDAVVHVKWTNTWNDPAKEKEAAKALIDSGADVIAQHQNTVGAQTGAAEAGVYSIGYNKDMSYANAKQLTAPIWHWDVYCVDAVQRVLDGTWEAGSHWLAADTGIVDIAPLHDDVSADTKALVEKEFAAIKDGTQTIFVGPLYDQSGKKAVEDGVELTENDLQTMMWFVQGVDGKVE